MELKYIDESGQERTLHSSAELAEAIKGCSLNRDSLVYESVSGKWKPASAQPDCAAAFSLTQQSQDRSAKKEPKRWPARLVFLSAWVILLLGAPLLGLSAYRTGYLLGESIPLALLILIIGYFTGRKKMPLVRERINIGVAVAFWLFCAFLLTKTAIESHQAQTDIAAIHATMDRFVDAAKQAQGGQAVPVTPAETPPRSVGAGQTDLQKIAALLDRTTRQTLETGARYQETIQRIGFSSLLTPTALCSVVERQKLHEGVGAALAAIAKFEKESAKNEASVRSDFQTLGLSSVSLDQAMAGFENGAQKSRKDVKDFIQVERDFVATVDELATLADISHPSTSRDGKQVLFSTQNFADRFNELEAKIRALAAQEDKILKRQTERLIKARDEMRTPS